MLPKIALWIVVISLISASAFATELSGQSGDPNENECEIALKAYKPLPQLQIVPVEREISADLEHFFTENPRALSIFRTAFYGGGRNKVNTTLVAAFENIPAHARPTVAGQILLEVLAQKYSSHVNFCEKVIEASLAWNRGPELLQLPTYFYYDLLKVFNAVKANGYRVLVFRDGRGEFAMVQNGSRSTTWYYALDDKKLEAHPISEDLFNSSLQWRQRLPQASGWVNAALNLIGLGAAEKDPVQTYEQSLSNDLKPTWRYVMNSLSDESYALVRYLLKRGATGLERGFNPSEVESMSRNLSEFLRDIWTEAARIGYKVKLNDSVYAEPELGEILNAYHILRASMDGGEVGYRVATFENKTLYFVKERDDQNQLVFVKRTKEQFEASQRKERARIDESFKRYDQVPEITVDVDMKHFPDHIAAIPTQYLSTLNIMLDPGYASIGGFKQPTENLTDLIRTDAETVSKLGYTHKRLAEWLQQIINLAENEEYMVKLNGRSYEVMTMGYMGFQASPFGDNVAWSRDYIVLDMQTGKRIQFTGGHPYMIGYYGFFEGNVEYRVPPDELISFIEGR